MGIATSNILQKQDEMPGLHQRKIEHYSTPGQTNTATIPFEQANFNLISTVTSIEGLNYPVLFVDTYTYYR